MEKTVEKYPCFTSFLIAWRFVIVKIEMTHFSGFPHSIERFEFYKNMSFLKIKNIDDLIITKAKYRRTMIFYEIILIVSRIKTISDLCI